METEEGMDLEGWESAGIGEARRGGVGMYGVWFGDGFLEDGGCLASLGIGYVEC